MQLLFIFISIFGTVYYTYSYKRFDFFTFSFFSALIYFMPGFFGEVRDPYSFELIPLYYDCYYVFNLVLITNILFSFLRNNKKEKIKQNDNKITDNKQLKIIAVLAIAGFISSVLSHPYAYNGELNNKVLQLEMLDKDGSQFEIFWTFGSVLLVISSSILNRRIYLIIGLFLLGLDVLLGGNRSSTSFAVMGLVIIFLHSQRKTICNILFASKNIIRTFVLSGSLLVFFLIKPLMPFIVNLDLDTFLEIYEKSETNIFLDAISTTSEPFLIQTTLSETLRRNVKTDFLNPLDIVANIVGGKDSFYPLLKTSNIYLDQRVLFPGLDYGTAYNMYAFFWSSGGWIFLFCFIIFHNILILMGCNLLDKSDGYFKAFIIFIFILWTFYFHRNDLWVQINLTKRVVLLYLIVQIISYINFTISDDHS